MIFGSVDWPVCAADGMWLQRPLSNVNSLTGNAQDTKRYKVVSVSKCGVWTGCGQRQCTPSRQQVARDEAEESLTPFSFPTLRLSLQPANR